MHINYNNINNNNNNGNGNGNHNVSDCNSIGDISNYICDKCKDNGNKYNDTHAHNTSGANSSNCENNNNSIGALRDCRCMQNNYERSICGQNCSCNNNSNTATSDNFNCGNNGTRQTTAICSSAAVSVGNLRAAINVRDNNRIRYYENHAERGKREYSRNAVDASMRQLQLLLPISTLHNARTEFALFHA